MKTLKGTFEILYGFTVLQALIFETSFSRDMDGSALETGVVMNDDDEEDTLRPRPPVVTIMGQYRIIIRDIVMQKVSNLVTRKCFVCTSCNKKCIIG